MLSTNSFPLTRQRPGRRREKGAFTLIELLVVIAIIGVLAALILPAYKASVAKSQSANCLSNLRQIGVAFRMYLSEHEDTLPPLPNWWAYGGNTSPSEPARPINAYLSSPKVFQCPGDQSKKGTDGGASIYAQYGNSYAINQALVLPGLELSSGRAITVERPTMVALLGDTTIYSRTYTDWRVQTWHGDPKRYISNVLFFDGHAEAVEIANSPLQSYGAPYIDSEKRFFWVDP